MDANIKNLRDALEWLDRRIREEAMLDGEMTNDHAIQLGFIQSMLWKFPLRNCDRFATAAEAVAAHKQAEQNCPPADCPECPYIVGRKSGVHCFEAWLFAPTAKEGGDHADA